MSGTRLLFLARHGETDWNTDGRWQGQTDVPLNERGRAQARALAEALRNDGIASVVSSDLARARMTAEIVARELGVAPVHLDAGLREQGFGCFEGLTKSECEARFPDAWARYLADSRCTPPGGESHADLVSRMRASVHRIAESLPGPALVVVHGGAMRALVSEQLGSIATPASPAWSSSGIPNGGILRLGLTSDRIVSVTQLR